MDGLNSINSRCRNLFPAANDCPGSLQKCAVQKCVSRDFAAYRQSVSSASRSVARSFYRLAVLSPNCSIALSFCCHIDPTLCHPVAISFYHPVILSPDRSITLSFCRQIVLSPCHSVARSTFHPVSLSPDRSITLLFCRQIVLSPCHSVARSIYHPVILLPDRSVTTSFCRPAVLSPVRSVEKCFIGPVVLSLDHSLARLFCLAAVAHANHLPLFVSLSVRQARERPIIPSLCKLCEAGDLVFLVVSIHGLIIYNHGNLCGVFIDMDGV